MTTQKSTEEKNESAEKAKNKKAGEVHTDYPLSEKDEVKKAEENLQKGQKKADK